MRHNRNLGYPTQWFKTLCEIMGCFGMHQCIGDEGTYTNSKNSVIVGTHVGDLLGIAPTEEDLDRAERAVEKRVELDKKSTPSKMLGMELHWKEKEEVTLCQTALIESTAKKYLQLRDGDSGGERSLPLDPHTYEKEKESEQVNSQF